MKVKLTSKVRASLYNWEILVSNVIIKNMSEDDTSAKDAAKIAAKAIAGTNSVEILRVDATMARNARIFGRYFEESGQMDVWIDFTAMTDEGFIIGGAYLTDIWDLSDDDREEFCNHAFIRKFAEVK